MSVAPVTHAGVQPAERILYSFRADGLGTRLIAIGWAWRLARLLDARAVVAWPGTPGVLRPQLGRAMPLELLFDQRALAFATDQSLRFQVGAHQPEPDWPFLTEPGTTGLVRLDPQTVFARGPVLCHRGYRPLLVGDETLPAARVEVGQLLRTLPLAPRLAAAIDAVAPIAIREPFVAMHFRRGDITAGLVALAARWQAGERDEIALDRYLHYYAHKSMPVATFLAGVAQERAAGRRIYLATDDAAMRARLAAEHGTAVFDMADAGLTPVELAMADIIVQSRADYILASASGFAAAAALYGSRPLRSPPIEGGADAFAADLDALLTEHDIGRDTRAHFAAMLRENPLLKRRLATA